MKPLSLHLVRSSRGRNAAERAFLPSNALLLFDMITIDATALSALLHGRIRPSSGVRAIK